MIEIYVVKKGFSEDDARRVIHTYTSKPEYWESFIDHMMVEELGFIVPHSGDSLGRDGVITSLSFMLFGSIPLWVLVILEASDLHDRTAQLVATGGSALLSLFALGVLKARITREMSNKLMSGLLLLANGTLAAIVAFLIGWAVHASIGEKVECSVAGVAG